MKKTLLLAGAAALALTGCIVTSVHPFYTRHDLIFEDRVVGAWSTTNEAPGSWTFERAEGGRYTLRAISGNETNTMRASLFKLNRHVYFDLFSAAGEGTPP